MGRGRSRGFTLLELLLAMGLMAMLGLVLYSALRVAFRAQASAMSGVESVRGAQVAMELVGRELGGALPPTGVLAGAFYGVPAGSGADLSDAVQFYAVAGGVSDVEDPTRADGIKRIEFAVEAVDGVRCLVRRVQGNLTSTEEFLPDREVLCRNVASLSLAYFDGMTWQESWDSTAMQDALPIAVRVGIELEPRAGAGGTGRAYRMVRVVTLRCADVMKMTGGI